MSKSKIGVSEMIDPRLQTSVREGKSLGIGKNGILQVNSQPPTHAPKSSGTPSLFVLRVWECGYDRFQT